MIENGLLYYGKFNDTVRDYSGYNDGLPNNLTLTTDKNGDNNMCYQFNDSNIIIEKLNSSTFDPNADFTFSYWFYADVINPIQSDIISIDNRGSGPTGSTFDCIRTFILNGSFYFRRRGTSVNQDISTSINTSTWYHVFAKYTASTKKTELYLNNIKIGEKIIDTTVNLGTVNDKIYIGSGPLGFSFYGKIDEVRLYQRALSDEERTQLYNIYSNKPVLSNLLVNGNTGNIEISFDSSGGLICQFLTVEYSLNGIDWNIANIKYNENPNVKPNSSNIILWDSKADFTTNESSVQIRIQSNDTIYDSNLLTSSTFEVNNQPILPVEPTISDLSKTGTEGNIEISLTVFDDYSLTIGEVEYQGADTNWYSCTLKYNTGKYFKSSDTGEDNIILWDSKADFNIDLITKLRARVLDNDEIWSDYIESMSFTVYNQYNAPVIDNINLSATSEDIEISFSLTEDKYSILQTEIQFLNDTEYFDCTIDYNPCLTTKGSSTGQLNTLYWKSYEDIQNDIITNLRIRVYDGQWSDWIYSSNFSLLNGSIPPKVFWYSPLKFKIDNEENIYFKIRKEQL